MENNEETLLERERRIEKILQGQGRNHIALYKVIGDWINALIRWWENWK